ncbi:MAG: patatin-like phospholipase family protein [Myxococcaceae bacterium]|nr:patatin-like phospholipase family protein [Myxococcaceae bacterium]
MEIALVRAAQLRPELVNPVEEAVLRTALSVARLYKVRHEGRDVGVGALVAPFREDVARRLGPVLLGNRPPAREQLVPIIRDLRDETLRTRDEVIRRLAGRVPPEAVHREIRHKALVLVSGGGGGTGYVYLGVMDALDEVGVKPALLVGTSIGGILSLFRSRMPRFDQTEMQNIVRGLSWRKLFRVISMETRYGLPGALRLLLRAGLGRWFDAHPERGTGIRLRDLPIPVIMAVSGVRKGMLPHPVEFYERLVNLSPAMLLRPAQTTRQLQAAMQSIAEFVTHPEIMVKLHLGADPDTAEFDALDAAGFSCALPGIIHYDVLRDDPRMHELLGDLFAQKKLGALIDGGLVDNLPARAAWRAVHKGRIGTRNAFILALNAFAQRITTPLWLPLQRLAETNVAGNRPYAHLLIDFRKTLSPLELVPSVELTVRAIEMGRAQITRELPFLMRMLAPLPVL